MKLEKTSEEHNMRNKILAILMIALVFMATSVASASSDLKLKVGKDKASGTADFAITSNLPLSYGYSLEEKGNCDTCTWHNVAPTQFFLDFPVMDWPVGLHDVFYRISASQGPWDSDKIYSNVMRVNYGREEETAINPYSIDSFGVGPGEVTYFWENQNNLPEGVFEGSILEFSVSIEEEIYTGNGTVEKVYRQYWNPEDYDMMVHVNYDYTEHHTNIVTQRGNYQSIRIIS